MDGLERLGLPAIDRVVESKASRQLQLAGIDVDADDRVGAGELSTRNGGVADAAAVVCAPSPVAASGSARSVP